MITSPDTLWFTLLNGQVIRVSTLCDDPDIVLSEDDLKSLFQGRCVCCGMTGGSIHELNPRSVDPDWPRWSNRVLLCAKCHEWAHRVGTRTSRTELIRYRDRVLRRFYDCP